MSNGYTRQAAAQIAPLLPILSAPFNSEFNAIEAAFSGTTGHAHDGTLGNGPQLTRAALAGFGTGTGLVTATSGTAFAARTLTAPAAGITITNPDGVAGNPTFALANDLAAVEGLSTTGIATRTATDTWTTRAITGTTNQITLTNGDGVAGAPTISLPAALVVPGSLTTTTTLAVGTNATVAGTLGVTGTTTLAAVNATNGSFSGTLGVTGATNLTGSLSVGTTLGVTGTSTLAAVNATNGSFSGTLSVISTSSFTGAITATGGVVGNLTGNVTGNVSGSAGSAATLTTSRNFSVAGSTGLTASAVAFNGSADVALTLTGTLALANGGTGATTAANARTNLGLGTIATQAASNVAITGGAIDGTTIGGTTAAAGTFTTLTSTSETSGSVTVTGSTPNASQGIYASGTNEVGIGLAGAGHMFIGVNGTTVTGSTAAVDTGFIISKPGSGTGNAVLSLLKNSVTGTQMYFDGTNTVLNAPTGTLNLYAGGGTGLLTVSTTAITANQLVSAPGFVPSNAAGGIGTYMFARTSTGSPVFNDVVLGSTLLPSGISTGGTTSGTAQTGSWRCMGYAGTSTSTVFVRIL